MGGECIFWWYINSLSQNNILVTSGSILICAACYFLNNVWNQNWMHVQPPPFACSRCHQPPAELSGETPRRGSGSLHRLPRNATFPWISSWMIHPLSNQIKSNQIISSHLISYHIISYHIITSMIFVMTSMSDSFPNPAWLERAWASGDSPINSHPKGPKKNSKTFGPPTIRHQNAHRLAPEKRLPHIMFNMAYS